MSEGDLYPVSQDGTIKIEVDTSRERWAKLALTVSVFFTVLPLALKEIPDAPTWLSHIISCGLIGSAVSLFLWARVDDYFEFSPAEGALFLTTSFVGNRRRKPICKRADILRTAAACKEFYSHGRQTFAYFIQIELKNGKVLYPSCKADDPACTEEAARQLAAALGVEYISNLPK